MPGTMSPSGYGSRGRGSGGRGSGGRGGGRGGGRPPRRGAYGGGGSRGRRPDRKTLWRRRLVFLAIVVAVMTAGAVTAWALIDGGDPDLSAIQNDPQPAAVASPEDTSEPSPSPSPSPPKDTVIEIGWVGDTTPGSKYGLPPDNGRALFTQTRSALQKPDLMIANIEGTYSTATASKCDGLDSSACFAFQAPPAYAKALAWAGVDMASIANNHAFDYFQAGFDQTKEALTAAGVEYTGVPDEIPVVDVKGVRVAVLAFSPYDYNPNVNDIPAAVQLVKEADEKADLVVVTMHVGAEGSDKIHTPTGPESAYGENRGDSRAFAHSVIDAGADLVLGAGPHVIRGIERYNKRLIAYSLGNFGGWDNFGVGGNLSLSGLLKVRLAADGTIKGGRWLSLYIDDPGVPRIDTAHTAANLVRQLSAEDFDATYELSADGSFKGD